MLRSLFLSITSLVVLSGCGAIIVAIMPNETAYHYFSDGNAYRYLAAIRESHRIRPMCGNATRTATTHLENGKGDDS